MQRVVVGTARAGSPLPAGGQPTTPQSSAAPAWGAATHLDYSQGGEDPTSGPAHPQASAWPCSDRATRLCTTEPRGASPPSYLHPPPASQIPCHARPSASAWPWTRETHPPLSSTAARGVPLQALTILPRTPWGAWHRYRARHRASAPPLTTVQRVHFNGTSWSPATVVDPGNELGTVSCPSTSFCAAVDYGPNVVTFNGTSWSKPSAIDPGTYLQAVSCASASFCVAIDRKGNALTFNGRTWSPPVNADPNGLSMGEGGISWPVVSCPTSNFCAAVDGASGNVVTFDGRGWTAPVNIDSKAANSEAGRSLCSLCRCPACPPRSAWPATPPGMRSSEANGHLPSPASAAARGHLPGAPRRERTSMTAAAIRTAATATSIHWLDTPSR